MISVTVKRDPADKPGPTISDNLILTEAVARARGIAEIDQEYTDRRIVNGSCSLRNGINPGAVVEVQEAEESWKGMVKTIAYVFDIVDGSFTATMPLVIEKNEH